MTCDNARFRAVRLRDKWQLNPGRAVCEDYNYRTDRSDRSFLFLSQAREVKLEVDHGGCRRVACLPFPTP